MRLLRWSFFLLLLLSACHLFTKREAAKAVPEAPSKPAWTTKKQFYDKDGATHRLYGIGSIAVPKVEKGDCPEARTVAQRALGRARAQLVGILDGRTSVATSFEISAGDVPNSEPAFGWIDDEKTLFVGAKIETSTPPQSLEKFEVHAPIGGLESGQIIEVLREVMLSKLDESGICKDPYRRHTNRCCGPAQKFCFDKARYSRMLGPGQCACGQGLPCLNDFICETSQTGGGSRCVCRGKKCPCEVRNCKLGETCGDGRCY